MPPPAPTDANPPQAAAGDPRNDLARHIPDLRAFATSLTRNPASADDLVQETILKAWSHIGSFRPGTDLRAWLFTILRNSFFSARRKVSREVPDPDGIYAGALAVLPDHDGRLAFREFLAAFHQLSAEHREVLVLVGANGYSCEEAAAMTGVPVGTVKSRVARARARLAALMGIDLPAGAAVPRGGAATPAARRGGAAVPVSGAIGGSVRPYGMAVA